MREAAFIVAGVAVGLVWIVLWSALLRGFGFDVVQPGTEDCAKRRERLKRLGKLRYFLIYGMLGSGFAFGLAMITIDFVSHRFAGWASQLIKFVFLAVCFGAFQGYWGWSRAFRNPVPFPPNYPPTR